MTEFWEGRRVFLTGHTGFKGGWLSLWLARQGAQVHGFSLPPTTDPSFFEVCRVEERITSSVIGDVRDIDALNTALIASEPEVVFHLAAQPLVRESYARPVGTYATNVMGLVNLFECVRGIDGVRALVNVTSDKCYENRERMDPYVEGDRLGGRDPYSNSKACSELVTSAYRDSFLRDHGVAVATARAGNVIGGGDWAADRLIPDLLRAHESGEVLHVRSPLAIRPWQHVLEPLSGYLKLAESLCRDDEAPTAVNFGPSEQDSQPVSWIVERMCELLPGASWRADEGTHPHEAGLLRLDSCLARERLGWSPRWDLGVALQQTVAWELSRRNGDSMVDMSMSQIAGFEETR